ncbi:imidazole glycerol phosphate synthase subunit HisH [Dinghuibacter silviterrae]|uniref:Imidazole glycerol phosphate synthase subunit HisH n=1 Tax=Dinghuibacter silviterrae TaxID=1539049 RepID=A0A4R8DRV6_9BACT|nr:imidazole glycerol phosphate synthase subunit HisH [Dinghuibacter silviterrae]TDX00950.1 glutamine amidotransferase [Dinghuibacter silviterrae]
MTVIIQYNAGNIQSVRYALARIGAEAIVTDDPARIRSADRVIFPGVGEASTAMNYLRERGLDDVIRELQQPVLGICLGMQLMCAHSEENDTSCLGIFEEKVRLFRPEAAARPLKVPQIGWNAIDHLQTPLFAGVSEGAYVYCVHSFYAALGDHTIAQTDYVQPYSSGLHRDNFYGVQFHPEKSASVGETILKNFMRL